MSVKEVIDVYPLLKKQIDAILEENEQSSSHVLLNRYDGLDLDNAVLILFVGASSRQLSSKVSNLIASIAGTNESIFCLESDFDSEASERLIGDGIQAAVNRDATRPMQDLSVFFVVDIGDESYSADSLSQLIDSVFATCVQWVPSHRHSMVTLIDSWTTARESPLKHLDLVRSYRNTDYPFEFCFILENRDERFRPVIEVQLSALIAYVVLLLNNTHLLNPTDLKNSVGSSSDRICSIARNVIDVPLESIYKAAVTQCFSNVLSILRDNALSSKTELSRQFLPSEIIGWVEDRSHIDLTVENLPVFDKKVNLGAFGTLRDAEKEVFGDRLDQLFANDLKRTEKAWARAIARYKDEARKQVDSLFVQQRYGFVYTVAVIGESEYVAGSIQNQLVEKIAHLEQLKRKCEQAIEDAYASHTVPRVAFNTKRNRRRVYLLINHEDATTIRQQETLKRELKAKIYNRRLEIEKLNRQITVLGEIGGIIKERCARHQVSLEALQQVGGILENYVASTIDPFYITEINASLERLVAELLDAKRSARLLAVFSPDVRTDQTIPIGSYLQVFKETMWPGIYEKFKTLDDMFRFLSSQGFSKDICINKLYEAAKNDIAYPYRYVDSWRYESKGMEVRFLVGDVETELADYTKLYHPYIGRFELVKLRIGINPDNLFILQSGAQ